MAFAIGGKGTTGGSSSFCGIVAPGGRYGTGGIITGLRPSGSNGTAGAGGTGSSGGARSGAGSDGSLKVALCKGFAVSSGSTKGYLAIKKTSDTTTSRLHYKDATGVTYYIAKTN